MSDGEILVALSGGIDSAVSAWLLREAGYSPRCVFLKNWDEDDSSPDCTFAEDLAAAQSAADFLGLPLELQSFSLEYYEQVFEPMVEAYRQGRTPNPDLWCNQVIKFDAFAGLAEQHGTALFATGHYARTPGGDGALRGPGAAPRFPGAGRDGGDGDDGGGGKGFALLCAADAHKDQTYFLSSSPARGLARCLFPIGGMTRRQVRQRARDLGLPNAERRGTSGICFINPRDFPSFLGRYIPPRPGQILGWEGQRLGRHGGAHAFTPGQRRGLGIGGQTQGSGQPWYVACTDVPANLVLAVQGQDPRLDSSWMRLGAINWIGAPGGHPGGDGGGPAGSDNNDDAWLSWLQGHEGREGRAGLRCRIRHGGDLLPCRLEADDGGNGEGKGGGNDGHGLRVVLASPQPAIAPGQQCAFYLRGRCLGGGEILDCQAVQAAKARLAQLA